VNPRPLYLDSSAVVKLVFEEAETSALESFLIDRPLRVSSSLVCVEVMRAVRSVGDGLVSRHAKQVLAALTLIAPDAALLAEAADLDPISLRALDAIHLATAVTLVPDLDGIVVYDLRLADAARHAGLTVWAPS